METPDYIQDNPVMQLAYQDFIFWAWDESNMHNSFAEETGFIRPNEPLDILIDQATGLENHYVEKWIEWVTEFHWNGTPPV